MGEDTQVVAFKIGDEEFAVPIRSIQEIIRMVEITRLPNVPDFIEGVINLRGKVIPVVDLRKRFGLPQKERDGRSRIIVISLNGGDRDGTVGLIVDSVTTSHEGRCYACRVTVGLIVDSVTEVLRLEREAIESLSGMETGIGVEYIEGVGKVDERLIILLNIKKVLTAEEREILHRVEQGSRAGVEYYSNGVV